MTTLGEIEKKYGSWENYKKTSEGILSSIETCKSLIEEEKEKVIDLARMYEMGEPLENINIEKEKIAKSILWYENKIKLLFYQLKNG